ncbi:MAG TPA: glutathione S-transferase family protein, partial [bacterium]
SYCWKAEIALYENKTPFTFRLLDAQADPATFAEFEKLWPLKHFPLLLDGGKPFTEATIIIEHLDVHHRGPVRMIPADADAAVHVRFMDRFFDNYVHTPMQTVVYDSLRAPADRSTKTVADAKGALETSYAWLEQHMKGREWAATEGFTLADCAAGPALFYADWVHPISGKYPTLRAYRSRLNARPSLARIIEEARPYRSYFPLGAPNRD